MNEERRLSVWVCRDGEGAATGTFAKISKMRFTL